MSNPPSFPKEIVLITHTHKMATINEQLTPIRGKNNFLQRKFTEEQSVSNIQKIIRFSAKGNCFRRSYLLLLDGWVVCTEGWAHVICVSLRTALFELCWALLRGYYFFIFRQEIGVSIRVKWFFFRSKNRNWNNFTGIFVQEKTWYLEHDFCYHS